MAHCNIIFLHEAGFPTPPENLNPHKFGPERVVNEEGRTQAHGNSMHISGDDVDVRAYLRACGGKIWVTPNPMAGEWHNLTVKDESCERT